MPSPLSPAEKWKTCSGCGGRGFIETDNGGDGTPQYPIHAEMYECEICGGKGEIPLRHVKQEPV